MTKRPSSDTIIDSARAEFAEHGYAGARVDRIAARAGLNKQLIYYYFRSKAGLHAAAISSTPATRSVPAAPVTPGAIEGLRAVIGRIARSLEARPDIVSLLVDRAASSEARDSAGQWIRQAEQELAEAVSTGQGLGYFRDDADPRLIARQGLVLCVGYLAIASHLQVPYEEWTRAVGDTLARATAW